MSKILNDVPAVTFDDVLIVPAFSTIQSRKDVDTSVTLGKFTLRLPVISANMESITGLKMLNKMNEQGGLGILHRYMSIEELSSTIDAFRKANTTASPIAIAVGSVLVEKERINLCIDKQVDIICIDIAHGDSLHVHETLHYIRYTKQYTGVIIAGNVCTPDAARALLEEGADLVKVGVGPGSVCTTRIKTGCGYPQLQAIIDTVEAVGPGKVIADGGIKTPGDAAKAIAAGAVAVMIGGMLAATDCVPGWDEAMDTWKKQLSSGDPSNPIATIIYRGMASSEARKSFGQVGNNAEGISKLVSAKPVGSTENILNELNEGLRSAMSYVGAKDISSFVELTKFIRVTTTTRQENIPHH